MRKTVICAFSGSYCCSSARFRFSLFESYSGCILAFCRLQLYLEITFRCMEYMHFKYGDRYLYFYLYTCVSKIQIFKNAADKWRAFTFFKPHSACGNIKIFSHSKLIQLSFCHRLKLHVLLCADGYFLLVFLFSRYRHSLMTLIYSHLSIYHC